MNKEEIMEFVKEKENNKIYVHSVSDNTNPKSDLGYTYEWYVDYEKHTEEYEDENGEIDEIEEIDWYLCCYRCGNGEGCFGVTDKYDADDEDDAYNQLLEEVYKGGVIEFTDGSKIITSTGEIIKA